MGIVFGENAQFMFVATKRPSFVDASQKQRVAFTMSKRSLLRLNFSRMPTKHGGEFFSRSVVVVVFDNCDYNNPRVLKRVCLERKKCHSLANSVLYVVDSFCFLCDFSKTFLTQCFSFNQP